MEPALCRIRAKRLKARSRRRSASKQGRPKKTKDAQHPATNVVSIMDALRSVEAEEDAMRKIRGACQLVSGPSARIHPDRP